MDLTTNEPLFTNCTKHFFEIVDYIFYTTDSLMDESLLDILDEEILRKEIDLPSCECSYDHIALLSEL